jgi:FMN-dependent NADH-azoreductase
MTKLLHIVASPREEKSRTLQVSELFLQTLIRKHPEWIFDELRLEKEKVPSLTIKQVDGKYMLLLGKDLFGEAKEAWDEIILHIERFLSADLYLISTPMWNFTLPYPLKQYIDLIVQPKYLFNYTKTGVEGLAKNKKMIVISSSGGEYSSKEMKPFDFVEPYLRAIFGFVGITNITFVKAESMDMGKQIRDKNLEQAKKEAIELANKL